MAEFDVIKEENMRFVRILLDNETVRAEAGALAYHKGKISMTAALPSPLDYMRSSMIGEAPVRPTYSGVGELILESSLDGYFVLSADGADDWLVTSGAFWAAEGSISLGLFREKAITSFWAGEGFLEYRTRLTGIGKIVLKVSGPVEEIDIPEGEEIAVEGQLVIGRTARTGYQLRRAAKSILASMLSGESALRVYTGPGKVLLNSTPYWSNYIARSVRGSV
jgi:uncharacterized protein (AIM24 family)